MAQTDIATELSKGPVMLDDSTLAGFLVSERGTCKEYCAFKVTEGLASATFVRLCTPEEKRYLKKLVYGERCVKSVRCTKDADEEGIMIFTIH
jgi:hypothetical protein